MPEELKDKDLSDTKRRLFDITIPISIAQLSQELKDFKEEIHRKLDNGISSALNRMVEKVMSLQCNVHLEKFNNLEEKLSDKFDMQDKKIHGLYGAFVVVVIVGIVLGVWMRR